MSHLDRDPWVDVKTVHGFSADHVISALQKEIRRGHAENAALLAYEMITTSPALEEYLWYRLKVISVEDIGFGDSMAPVLIQSLFEMTSACDHSVGERKLYAIHAVRYLCGCQKDRSSDEMINWIIHTVENGEGLPVIPDYALDMHTAEGQKKGRGRRFFFEEASKTEPELPGRDKTYLQRIIKMLDEGKLKD
ncbi:MAG: AAA family ATPase [Anaerolineae bacterium]|nr:AAA family ATPase [Anaerolineae bacterium]